MVITAIHPLFETMLPAGWQLLTVDDIKSPEKSSCVAGPFGSNISSRFFVESGVPIIRGNNLRDDLIRFVPEAFAFVSEEQAIRYKAQHVRGGDLVFTCWGTLGQVGLIPNDGPFREYIISNKQLKLRPNLEIADPLYLFFYFAGPNMVQHILGKAIGAAVPGINLGILKKLPVVLPPLPVQRHIANILSAYDDLIENNQRRIKVLETMARALYREWFVHFRFPGHENVPRVGSPLGEIPKGWEVKSVAESFEIFGGGTPSRKIPEYWDDGTIKWFSPSDLTGAGTIFMDDSSDHITLRGLAESSARLFPAYSVMLTSRATIGAIAINTSEACTNQGFITCLPNERVPLYFLYHWLTENVSTFQRMASGATFKEISRGVFKTIKFLHPSEKHVRHFENCVGPMAEQIHTLQRQIQNLRRTRDMLLPRLLSGQIDMSATQVEPLEATQ